MKQNRADKDADTRAMYISELQRKDSFIVCEILKALYIRNKIIIAEVYSTQFGWCSSWEKYLQLCKSCLLHINVRPLVAWMICENLLCPNWVVLLHPHGLMFCNYHLCPLLGEISEWLGLSKLQHHQNSTCKPLI